MTFSYTTRPIITTFAIIVLLLTGCGDHSDLGSSMSELNGQEHSAPNISVSPSSRSASDTNAVLTILEGQVAAWNQLFEMISDPESLVVVYSVVPYTKALMEAFLAEQIGLQQLRLATLALIESIKATGAAISAEAAAFLTLMPTILATLATIAGGAGLLLSATERGAARIYASINQILQHEKLEKAACLYGALGGPLWQDSIEIDRNRSDVEAIQKFATRLADWLKTNGSQLATLWGQVGDGRTLCGRIRYLVFEERFVGPELANVSQFYDGNMAGYRPVRRVKVTLAINEGIQTTKTNDSGFFFFSVSQPTGTDLYGTLTFHAELEATSYQRDGQELEYCDGADWSIRFDEERSRFQKSILLPAKSQFSAVNAIIDLDYLTDYIGISDSITTIVIDATRGTRLVQLDQFIEAIEFLCARENPAIQIEPLVLESRIPPANTVFGYYVKGADSSAWGIYHRYDQRQITIAPYYLYQVLGSHYLDQLGRNDAQFLSRDNTYYAGLFGSRWDARYSWNMGWSQFFAVAVAKDMAKIDDDLVGYVTSAYAYGQEELEKASSRKHIYDIFGVGHMLWQLYQTTNKNFQAMTQAIKSDEFQDHKGFTNALLFAKSYQNLYGDDFVYTVADSYLNIPLPLIEDAYDEKNILGAWYNNLLQDYSASEWRLYNHHICPNFFFLPTNIELPPFLEQLQGSSVALPDPNGNQDITNSIHRGTSPAPLAQWRWYLCKSGNLATIRNSYAEDEHGSEEQPSYYLERYERGELVETVVGIEPTMQLDPEEKHVFIVKTITADVECYSPYTYACDKDDLDKDLAIWVDEHKDQIPDLPDYLR